MMSPDSSAFATLAPLEPLMDKCVHCGFCLPTCPSYVLLGQEMDSPRGRIYLMRAGIEDRVAMVPSVVHHFDTCLGCMACETACPSGVEYAPLIEQTRAAIESQHAAAGRRTLVSPSAVFRAALSRPLAAAGHSAGARRADSSLAGAVEAAAVGLRSMLTLAPQSRSLIRGGKRRS